MKRVSIRIFLAALLLWAAGTPLFGVEAVIDELQGKVEVKEQGGTWEPAASGMRVSRGTFISTGFNSRAVLELGESVLEVRELTRMKLERIVEENEQVSTDLFLQVGKVKAEVKSTEGLRNNFKVRGPVSTAAVRGTTFIFDGYTLWVTEGTVVFNNLIGQRRRVGAGGESSTDGYSTPSGTMETRMDDIYEVESQVSGSGGAVSISRDAEEALAVLSLNWE